MCRGGHRFRKSPQGLYLGFSWRDEVHTERYTGTHRITHPGLETHRDTNRDTHVTKHRHTYKISQAMSQVTSSEFSSELQAQNIQFWGEGARGRARSGVRRREKPALCGEMFHPSRDSEH